MATIVNIGLVCSHGSDTALDGGRVLDLLNSIPGMRVTDWTARESNTEWTVIGKLSRALTPDEAHAVAVLLRQDCIAQRVDGAGALHGPKAAEWGAFNPEFFLTF